VYVDDRDREHLLGLLEGVVGRYGVLLRGFPWSSYGAYAGYRACPSWLTREELPGRVRLKGATGCGAYRAVAEDVIRQGEEEALAVRMRTALAVGSQAFLERLRAAVRGDRRTQPDVRAWQRLMPFERIRQAVAAEKGEPWDAFRDRKGDWGRDVALLLGRRHCGLTLGELGREAGGVAAAAVGAAIGRMERRVAKDRHLRRQVAAVVKRLGGAGEGAQAGASATPLRGGLGGRPEVAPSRRHPGSRALTGGPTFL